jgi:hypothetical protein
MTNITSITITSITMASNKILEENSNNLTLSRFFDNFYFDNFPIKRLENKLVNKLLPHNISINNTEYTISENEIIEKRLTYLKNKVSPLFISLVKSEDFEFGQKSESIKIVENELNENRFATQYWLNDLYIQYFSTDEKILIGILRVFEYFDEDVFYPTSHTIALASLVNRSDEIKEVCVRIFENWGSIKSYEILKGIKTDTKWLQAYINQVIKDIEKDLYGSNLM